MAAARTPSLHELITDDLNFGVWSLRMRIALRDEGLWDVVENGVPPHPSKDPDTAATLNFKELCRWRDLVRQDMKALEILQSSLTDSIFKKTVTATSAKELWEMLQQAPEVSYDADMWMVHTNTANHMTPHEKYFTTLDKAKRDKVTFMNGSTVEAQGIGDVRILTREGKTRTIEDVLFVPGIVANVLSVGEMNKCGYVVKMGPSLITIRASPTPLYFSLYFRVLE